MSTPQTPASADIINSGAHPGAHYLATPPDLTAAQQRKKGAQYFATPPDVAEELLDLAAVARGDVVLEPSAGTGAIAAMIAHAGAAVDCVERDPGYAAVIRKAGYARTVTVADFLALPAGPAYDKVIMNPPFSRNAYAAHIRHALKFVRPGGRLVAVLPSTVQQHPGREEAEIRELIRKHGDFLTELPANAFAQSGTGVRAVIALIPVPAAPRPPDGEVRRVTVYPDVEGEHFDPLTAAAGAYVYTSAWEGRDVVFRDAGNCVGCGALTWARDDGDHDDRGPFGCRTYHPLALKAEAPDGTTHLEYFPMCAQCSCDRDRYEHAVSNARAALARPPDGQIAGRPVSRAPVGQSGPDWSTGFQQDALFHLPGCPELPDAPPPGPARLSDQAMRRARVTRRPSQQGERKAGRR